MSTRGLVLKNNRERKKERKEQKNKKGEGKQKR